MIDRRIDYLTLVVERPLTKNIMIPGFDEDGLPANTTLMTLDVLGHEFFIAMGEKFLVDRPFITSSIEYFRTENKTIYWRPFPNRAELQFKGKFFLLILPRFLGHQIVWYNRTSEGERDATKTTYDRV